MAVKHPELFQGGRWCPAVPVAGWQVASIATVAFNYGWQIHPIRFFFNSGLVLLAAGHRCWRWVTVAFAGEQGSYGNLVVVNAGGPAATPTCSVAYRSDGYWEGGFNGTGANPICISKCASSLGWVANHISKGGRKPVIRFARKTGKSTLFPTSRLGFAVKPGGWYLVVLGRSHCRTNLGEQIALVPP